jgi:hypothetical protein
MFARGTRSKHYRALRLLVAHRLEIRIGNDGDRAADAAVVSGAAESVPPRLAGVRNGRLGPRLDAHGWLKFNGDTDAKDETLRVNFNISGATADDAISAAASAHPPRLARGIVHSSFDLDLLSKQPVAACPPAPPTTPIRPVDYAADQAAPDGTDPLDALVLDFSVDFGAIFDDLVADPLSMADDDDSDDDDDDNNNNAAADSDSVGDADAADPDTAPPRWLDGAPVAPGTADHWLWLAASGNLSALDLVFGADFDDLLGLWERLLRSKSSSTKKSLSGDYCTALMNRCLKVLKLAVGVSPLAHLPLEPWQLVLWSELSRGTRKSRLRPPRFGTNPRIKSLFRLLRRMPWPDDDPALWTAVDQLRFRAMVVSIVRIHTGARSGDLVYAMADESFAHTHAVTGVVGTSVFLWSDKVREALRAQSDASRKLWLEADVSGKRPWLDGHRALDLWMRRRAYLRRNNLWSGPENSLFGVSSATLSSDARRLLRGCGLQDVRSHEMRGAMLSTLVAAGTDFNRAKVAFGWADASVNVRLRYERADHNGQLVHEAMGILDISNDKSFAGPVPEVVEPGREACVTCGVRVSLSGTRDVIVLCNTCSEGEHLACAGISEVPAGDLPFYCSVCRAGARARPCRRKGVFLFGRSDQGLICTQRLAERCGLGLLCTSFHRLSTGWSSSLR